MPLFGQLGYERIFSWPWYGLFESCTPSIAFHRSKGTSIEPLLIDISMTVTAVMSPGLPQHLARLEAHQTIVQFVKPSVIIRRKPNTYSCHC